MSGYNIGDKLVACAETQDGAFAGYVAELARKYKAAVIYGYPERADGVIYNSALCMGACGNMLAHHRKLILPPGFEKDYFTPGTNHTLFEINGIKIALMICYDGEFAENLRVAAQAGAEIIALPTALLTEWPFVAHKMMPVRAFENGVFLAYVNWAGREGDHHYLGASAIIDPFGQDLARAGSKPEILQAEIDLQTVQDARARLPYLIDCQKLSKPST